MRAEAVVEVEARGGRTVCTRLRSEPPITLRRTGEGVVHQVGSGAGPIGGDDLVLRVRVGPGASLTLRSVAAAIVQPGATGLPSRVALDAEVAEGGHLEVVPEPQVITGGSDHEVRTHVRLAPGATLCWRDESVFGRHLEAGGSLLHRLRVDRDGSPLVRTDLAVGPRWPDSLGPAGTGGARCLGTLLLVRPDAPGLADPTGSGPGSFPHGVMRSGQNAWGGGGAGRWEVLEVRAGCWLVVAVADTASALRVALDAPALVRS